jgi:hypothetical protein
VTATLALVLAIGGGSAWAVTHHYKITSLSQLKPSVVKQLESNAQGGAAGPQGPTGPQGSAGSAGTPGTNGTTGPTGPGAIPLAASVTVTGNDSTPVGPIPVQLQCAEQSGTPEALLLARASDGNAGVATRETGANSASATSPTSSQTNTLYPSGGTMQVASNYFGSSYLSYADGSALVYENAGEATMTSETITFELTVSGSGENGSCQVWAQITPS